MQILTNTVNLVKFSRVNEGQKRAVHGGHIHRQTGLAVITAEREPDSLTRRPFVFSSSSLETKQKLADNEIC